MKKDKPKGLPTPPKPCYIVDPSGKFYHPTQAPAGLSKCGIMLELKPKTKPYIFPNKTRALNHAREHTIRYLMENNLPCDPDSFIVKEV